MIYPTEERANEVAEMLNNLPLGERLHPFKHAAKLSEHGWTVIVTKEWL